MTSEDVRRTLGDLDEKIICLILATGATPPELIEAFHSLDDHDDERGDRLSPRVQRVRAVLDALWGDDEDDDDDAEDDHADWFQSVAR